MEQERETSATESFKKQRFIIRLFLFIQFAFFIVMMIIGFTDWGFCKDKSHWPYAWLGYNILFLLAFAVYEIIRLDCSGSKFRRFKDIEWRSLDNKSLLKDMQ